jgi:hypothetical protein
MRISPPPFVRRGELAFSFTRRGSERFRSKE